MPNLDIYIALDSHYRAMPVAIIVIKQTSGTGVTEYFLDILRKSYIVLCNVFQGDYTVIEMTGSYTCIGIEAYI